MAVTNMVSIILDLVAILDFTLDQHLVNEISITYQ